MLIRKTPLLLLKVLTITLCFFVLITKAQEPGIVGCGVSFGAMNYKGDLDDDLLLKFTRTGYGLHFYYLPRSRFNISIDYLHGILSCQDSRAEQLGNKFRNLSFFTNIDEISAQAIFRFQNRRKSFVAREVLVPYLFAGVSYFHFNPMRKIDDVNIELQKIGTEGQYLAKLPTDKYPYPAPYKLWQFNIPFGAGIKIKVAKQIDLGLESGYRKTFTDYLDDVSGRYPDKNQMMSQEGSVALYLSDSSDDPKRTSGRDSFSRRGDPDKKDGYLYSNISITYYLTTKIIGGSQRFTSLGTE